VGFSSPDDLDRFITVVRRELQASGFHDAADILANVQTTAFTTSSEWLGELGLAVKQIRRQQKLPAALDRQLKIILKEVGAAWR
jgi:hypothetical protein